MRHCVFAGILAAAAIAACGRPSSVPLSAEDLEAVRAIGRMQQEAINAENLDRVVVLYTPDAVSLPPGSEPLQGQEAIRRFWQGQLTGVKGTGSYTTMALYGENDVAYEAGSYTYTYTDTASVTRTRYGKFLVVLRRQTDGAWKIAAEMWNFSPAPSPPDK